MAVQSPQGEPLKLIASSGAMRMNHSFYPPQIRRKAKFAADKACFVPPLGSFRKAHSLLRFYDGGRTRARTLDPLIKETPALCVDFRYNSVDMILKPAEFRAFWRLDQQLLSLPWKSLAPQSAADPPEDF